VDGIEWIRLQYAYPSQFPLDALDAINRNAKVCHYLDMPLQHASDAMLKAMRRGITKRRTQELIDIIRATVPGIALRTSMISGFPGETLADHQELIEFIQHNRFERLGVFKYSHEENTAAHVLMDDVPTEEKERRAEELMFVQQGISQELNAARVGQTLQVLIDRKEGGHWVGRTQFDSPEVDNEVLIDATQFLLSPGSFVQATITAAEEFDLYATPVFA